MDTRPARSSVLITGASGTIGRLVTRTLAEAPGHFTTIVATDIRPTPAAQRLPGVIYEELDIRAPRLAHLLAEHHVDTVIHLAAVVSPGPADTRELQYDIDVNGTDNVLSACVAHGVQKLIYTSSGAAYGYHADNPALLTEDAPLRGNEVFAYAWHKKLVEERLAHYREAHPELIQLVFRVSTILGATVSNQITDIFERPVIMGLEGAATPFCFIWDQDVVGALLAGAHGNGEGLFNLTGDGVMTLREIAKAVDRPFVALPTRVVAGALGLLSQLHLTKYSAEQTLFLLHRPVLDNHRLKTVFGYTPQKNSRQVFELYRRGHAAAFTDKVVVITGGAGGIGMALARSFAAQGAHIALLDANAAALNAAGLTLGTEQLDVLTLPCDIRDPEACKTAIAAVIDHFGGIDVLVNNAGVSHRSLFSDTDPEVIRQVMEVNFLGAVYCTRAALPSIVARKGHILALSSIAGFSPLVGRTGYSASKHALHGFFDSLRSELHDSGVHILLACPPFTRTAIRHNALDAHGHTYGAQAPPPQPGELEPSDVADAIVDATAHRKPMVLFTPLGHASWWLSRIAPPIFERLMLRSQGKEFGV